MAVENFLQKALHLELEEKFLNGAAFIALLSIFFPWVGGEWLGRPVTYSGVGFFISFIGILIVLLDAALLLATFLPLYGGPRLFRDERTDTVRLLLASQAVVLTVAAWSVLTEFTLEFSRLELHFGLYVTLIANLVATLYAFLRFQQQKRHTEQSLFRHDDNQTGEENHEIHVPAPQTDHPEDYRIRH